MFETVGLFGKYHDASISEPLNELASHLEKLGKTVKLGGSTAVELNKYDRPRVDAENVDIDLAIVIGGDGTLLHVARGMAQKNVPIVGVNLGRLGFLTDIARKSMVDEIDLILQGEYRTENRMMLDLEVYEKDKVVYSESALNDVVVGRHGQERLISWQAYFDGQFVTSARSDGVILTTPTGSTAYALAAGGSIMHPGIDVISMVPVSPHTLSNRPIGLPAEGIVEMTIENNKKNSAHVSCDGQIGYNLNGDERLRITRSIHAVELLHTENYNYFATLRAKLGWGSGR